MRYVPKLSLVPEPDGGFTLLARTQVPSSAYSARVATSKAPAAATPPKDATAVRLPLDFKAPGRRKAGADSFVEHRLEGLKLKAGSTVAVYVTLKDKILGEASIVAAAGPAGDDTIDTILPGAVAEFSVTKTLVVTVSADECLEITIQATPAGNASSTTQQLHELGVVDSNMTRKHQKKIASEMAGRDGSINPDLINSGPNVTVAACAQSVYEKQGK